MEGRRSKRPRLISTDDDKGDKQMTTRFQERRHREESLRYVLHNHVVIENIASYLSLSDLKAASEVSRPFLQAIRGTRRFAQTTVLAITDDNLEAMKSIVRKTDYAWRAVKVGVKDPTNIVEDLRRVLKSAEFVSLEGRPWMNEDLAVDPVEVAMAVSLLTAVLSSTPKLSQLTIDIGFLSCNVGGVLASPAVQKTLSKLNRLDLVRKTKFDCYGDPQPPQRLSFYSEEENTFWSNFGLLTGLPNRLRCFKLSPIEEKSVDSLKSSVLRLLRNNRASLEELELHSIVWRIQELQSFTFPALKALTASSVESNRDTLTLGEFLKNQRSLEELTVTSMAWVRDLKTGLKECSVGLKKLHLTGGNSESDWSFLTSMNRLKDFRLNKCGEYEEGNRLLASLQKNQLESLSLEGIRGNCYRRFGFWRFSGVDDKFRHKTELLQGFRCLRRLSFLGSQDAMDDQLMQWLLKEFVTLEGLEFSHCNEFDAGITGKTTAEWGRGASFADLRRLKTLKIVTCPGVTPNGIQKSCVNVPSLESLEYSNPPGQIEESVVLELVEQNPRLERLRLDYDGDVDVGDLGKLKAKIKKKNPRVKLSLPEEEEDDDDE